MNTVSNGIYRPVQKLHPPSLLNQLIEQGATGCLQLSSGSSFWLLYLEQGQLIYASDLIDPFGRLDRYLRRMTAQAAGITSAVRVQVRLMFETPTADQQTQGSDYQAICWLVEQQHLTSQQAADLIEAMVHEVVEAFLPIQTGSYELVQSDLLAEFPRLCQLDLRAILEDCQTQMRHRQSSLPPISPKYSSFNATRSSETEPDETQATAETNTGSNPAIERLLPSRFRSFLPSDRFSNLASAADEHSPQPNWRQTWREPSGLSSFPAAPEAEHPSASATPSSDANSAPAASSDTSSHSQNWSYGQDEQQHARQDDRLSEYRNDSQAYSQGYSSEPDEQIARYSLEPQDSVEPAAAPEPAYRLGYGAESAWQERFRRSSSDSISSETGSSETGSSETGATANSTDIDPPSSEFSSSEAASFSETIRESSPAWTQPDADPKQGGTFGLNEQPYSRWTNFDRSQSRSGRRTGFDRPGLPVEPTVEPTVEPNDTPLQQQFRSLHPGSAQSPSHVPASTPPADPTLEELPPGLVQGTQSASSGKTYTIACIDDSPTVLQAIKGFLDDRSLAVVLISDPVKALMQIIRTRPDLILLDVTMPNLDGYELCSLLRKHPGFRGTPIVMVTSSTGFIDRAKAKLVGASGYLTKPFTQTDLLKIVFKHLN